MSEMSSNIIIIFAELGAVLLLVLLASGIYYIFGMKKEGKTTKDLIKHIKAILPAHQDKLNNHFNEDAELTQNKKDFNVKSLIDDERKIYERLINVSVSKDTSMLKLTINDINTLVNDYVKMLTLKGKDLSNKESDSRELILRKENEALRLENASLEARLTTSAETLESMMGEFSSMYEGGKKEGEQRLKNEMYHLKQSLDSEETKVKAELSELNKDKESE